MAVLPFNTRSAKTRPINGTNLNPHPAVKIAEVVGMPDPRLDEVPVAFVELHPGASLNGQELIDFCKGRIANYKVPRAIHFVGPGDWPMSATKVDKRGLRARLESLRSNNAS